MTGRGSMPAPHVPGWHELPDGLPLAALDDRSLRDIGVTRIEAEREAEKPFWR